MDPINSTNPIKIELPPCAAEITQFHMKEIYLVRHGETEWNRLGKHQGSEADIPLNFNGQKQAIKIGTYLKNYRIKQKQFDCICSSPMIRTRETCEIIKGIIGFEGDIQFHDALKERRRDKLSGLCKDDPMYQQIRQYETIFATNDPIEEKLSQTKMGVMVNTHFDLSYELDADLENRASDIINKIVNNECNKILIVSHAGLLYALIRKIFKISKVPEGDMTRGNNGWVAYLTYGCSDATTNSSRQPEWNMVCEPNTRHLGLTD